QAAKNQGMNLRALDANLVAISVDETTTPQDITALLRILAASTDGAPTFESVVQDEGLGHVKWEQIGGEFRSSSELLTHPVFNSHHAEHEMLRYIKKLESRDLSLTHSMIPLGSCTMKLNATAEMLPVSWPEFAKIHPLAPAEQTRGYQELFERLET